jgi:outer membrane protein
MKKTIIIGITILMTLSLWAQEETNRLSLDDVIYLAKKQSPDALIAKHRFKSSYWEFRSYKAQYLPSLVLDGNIPNYNRSIRTVVQEEGSEYYKSDEITLSSSVSINQRIGLTGGTVFIKSTLERRDDFIDTTTSFYSVPIQIGYSQPIFKYNAWKWNKKIEPLKYQEAQRIYLENIEQLSISATQHFFNLLLSQIQKEIAAKNYANYDTLYRIAQGRFNLGKIAENDLLQLELNLLRAESAVDVAELNLGINISNLKSFLRIKEASNIELLPPTKTDHFHVDAMQAVEEAKNNSSTGIAFARRLLQSESNVNAAKMNGRFDAELYALYGLNQSSSSIDDIYKKPDDLQHIEIGIKIPILDWGVARGNIKMAESQQELTRTSIEQERIDFEQNVFLNVVQFNMQEKQLYIAAKSDTVAQKRFDVTQKRYMIGKINDVLELKEAQLDNDNALKGYYQELNTYWSSYFELRKSTLYDFKENKRLTFNESDILD